MARPDTLDRLAAERHEIQRLAVKYGAEAEVELADGTRCDLLAPGIAWEVDWADKWYQGIGQALYYGLRAARTSGLILLTDEPGRDWRLLVRAAETCGRHGIEFRIELTGKVNKP